MRGGSDGETNELRKREEAGIRSLVQEIYVLDMYVRRNRGAFSGEFARCFHMLSPTLDGRTGETIDVRWIDLDTMAANPPKTLLSGARFDVVWVDVTGDAAVARIDVYEAEAWAYTDYVSLYRVKGAWKIVGKVFDRRRSMVV